MKKRLLLPCLLVLAAPVSAITLLEDFQDDTIGANPTSTDYTFTEASCTHNVQGIGFESNQSLLRTGANCQFAATYSTGDLCGSGAAWSNVFRIESTEANTAFALFVMSDNGLGGPRNGPQITVSASEGTAKLVWNDSGTAEQVELFGAGTIDEDVWYRLTVVVSSCSTEPAFCATFENVDTNGFTQTECNTFGPYVAPFSDLVSFQSVGSGAKELDVSFDDLCFGLECATLETVEGEPAEFNNGLIAFAASAGFISQESQLFFALILIGLATVTTSASSKWVAPGRFKNYLLMSVQTLIAVFCVIAAFLDLWMFLVAFMLGLFAVRGGSEVRNTFHQIREALQRQNDRVGEDISPTQVMEVQVSEREEAVERAFQRLEDQSPVTDTVEAPEGPAEAVSDDEGADS